MKKHLLAGFILTFLIVGALQWYSAGFSADPDGFYHARVSQIFVEEGLGGQFPWLAYTTWKDHFADQHFLYHLALYPFSDITLIPLSVTLFAAVFGALFYTLLGKLGVKGKVGWMLLMFLGSVDFLFRINLVKANTLSLALLCGTLLLLLAWNKGKRYRHLLGLSVLAFVFVWTYGGFVFLPVILGWYILAQLIHNWKLDLWPCVAVAVGIGLGLLLHPHSSNLLESLNNQLFQTGLGAGSEVPAGNEWLAYNLNWFIKTNLLILFVWFFSVATACYQIYKRHSGWLVLWFQLNAVFLFALALRHRRFIEYFVPFAIMAAAVTFRPLLARFSWQSFKKSLDNYWQVKVGAVILILIVSGAFTYDAIQAGKSLHDGTKSDAYRQAAQLIAERSQPGDIVLNTQWDQFPQLWYWNPRNHYIVGLDPTFMYIHDPDRYWAWRRIADDNPEDWQNVAETFDIMRRQLDSKFVFIEKQRSPDIFEFLSKHPEYSENIYDSESSAVFALK